MQNSKANQHPDVEVDALCLECGNTKPTTLATFWHSVDADERKLRCPACSYTTSHARVWREGRPAYDETDGRERVNRLDSKGLARTLETIDASEAMLAGLGIRLRYRDDMGCLGARMCWNRGPAGDWWTLDVADDLPMEQRSTAIATAWAALLPANNRDWLAQPWEPHNQGHPELTVRCRQYPRSVFASSDRSSR